MPFIKRRMPIRRFFAPRKRHIHPTEKKTKAFTLFIIIGICLAIIIAANFLKSVCSEMALANANDMITATINNTIKEKMNKGQYTYDCFVNLQKDNEGNITAISANMSRINTLSAEILQDIISSTNGGSIDLDIPIGNLLGSNILLGRGPNIPIKIILLTSSFADFRNELTSAGINQIKHQIILEIKVQINVLLPWEIKSTEVVSEVLIAETVIVGKVPDTYLSLNQP